GAGDVLLPEQLLATFSENIQTTIPTDLILNEAAADAFTELLLGLGNLFTADGFDPETAGTPGATGDFTATLTNILLVPGVQFQVAEIPEPTSVLVWGIISVAGVGIAR